MFPEKARRLPPQGTCRLLRLALVLRLNLRTFGCSRYLSKLSFRLTTLYLLLGSNLGERPALLQAAREQIAGRIGTIQNASALYETAPWGVTDQPAFLNQVLEVLSDLAPEEVLRLSLDIEHELGRVRYERWGARHLDIDLLYFGPKVLDSARLTVPHPRLHERRFTMVPLAELAPDFVHPVLQKTNTQLLAECPDAGEVMRWESS